MEYVLTTPYFDKMRTPKHIPMHQIILLKESPIICQKNPRRFLVFMENKIFTLFFHNDPLSMDGSKTIDQRKKLLKTCYKIIFNSAWSKKRFLEGISDESKKVVVLYNGVLRNIKKPPKKKKTVIFVGRIVPEKGVHLFKDAVKEIYELSKNTFVEETESLKQGAAGAGLTDND